ncbi:MAG: aconitate hydratase AcnA [Pseudohongiella sp.]|mgnify:CR=1 FL=1|nr:aconitate hydratase AcnA [Pseudohongiella sp.]|tara:strand:+ start:68022 stop:70676 length:2655 start_codon:yes stop_codon:yes gene_type:complete
MTARDTIPDTRRELSVNGQTYEYFSLAALEQAGLKGVSKLPVTLKILLENLLRHKEKGFATDRDVRELLEWTEKRSSDHEISFMPARVLMQDFTGVPAVVDLAAMRDAVAKEGGDPRKVNPLNPVDLVIDHSVMVDRFASSSAYEDNVRIEMERNRERYEFLRWGQEAFDNFRVVPPGTGICHQVNLEYLARCVWSSDSEGKLRAYPDTLVGTDSHTTMINGLAVLGWGVGGIEAEAAMLGQPISMRIPEVVGVKLEGRLKEGVTATDLVLTVAEMLRKHGVVGKFVEFFGPGLDDLTLADRATIANMSPEYGATCCFFAVDDETLRYMELSGRDTDVIELTRRYSEEQGLWRQSESSAVYSSEVQLDLATVEPSLAGPVRPQDRVALSAMDEATRKQYPNHNKAVAAMDHGKWTLQDGDVVIAAITSCTNTSNPAVMMAAGLLARNALEKGLAVKPWVKTSLAPGSKVVTHYLEKAGLQPALDQLGFNLVGYGCTTCIGNSGPLPPEIDEAIDKGKLTVCSVLSGNRNFEGRIHPKVRANWLASPPLVVAFALAGTTEIDLTTEALGEDKAGNPVYLRDIWPDTDAIKKAVALVSREMFTKDYADVFTGNQAWNAMPITEGDTYDWNDDSTYIQNPPFFSPEMAPVSGDIKSARIIALLGDSVTTDHISPAGSIGRSTPAGKYLIEKGVAPEDFNSYGSRRGNHEVMMRGTFANVRIRNEMLDGVEGGYTLLMPDGEEMSIYDAAMHYQKQKTPLVVIAGKEYGTGSSRDWAAKGTRLLGIQAVIAESFERIHRSNLAGMGVLPLQFHEGITRKSLKLTGSETINLVGLEKISAGMTVTMQVCRGGDHVDSVDLLCRLDTADEVSYYTSGGIMPFVVNKLMTS